MLKLLLTICPDNFLSQSDFLKDPQRNFHFVLIVAAQVDKSGTAYCRKDLA